MSLSSSFSRMTVRPGSGISHPLARGECHKMRVKRNGPPLTAREVMEGQEATPLATTGHPRDPSMLSRSNGGVVGGVK